VAFWKTRAQMNDSIKMDIKEIEWGVVCIYVAQDRDQWQVFVKMVMNIQVPQKQGMSWLGDH
jgi:hypothetical protein